ncbi:lipase family protein [Actinomadura kijaniata]|uniref:lipase family protein n=1 Tax=Actinomadura kijaniata TaxID=46161 RepID=UPI00082C001B|nr:lipase family protein [Actinomadura kijaniata]
MSTLTFDHKATGYGLPHARCLAEAADLAYKDERTVRQRLTEWGFDQVRVFTVPFSASFPIQDTQAYVAASDQMMIVAFRGTEARQIRDWLSDGGAVMMPYPGGKGLVHLGFHQALEAAWPQIRQAVQDLRDREQSLWFTGHSLGGALAMLAAARLHFDEPRLLADGVYTFGQPRTCDPTLAAAYDQALKGRVFRFVNNNDIVAQLPPAPVYAHVAAERYIDSRGKIHDKRPGGLLGGLADQARGHLADPLAPGTDGIADHAIARYITHLTRATG